VPATTWYKYKSTSDQDSTRDFRLARNPDRFCGPSSFTTAYVCSSFSPACDRRTFPLSPLYNCFSAHSERCPAADQPTYTSYTSTRSLAFVAATLTGCGRCAPAHSAHHTAKFFLSFLFLPLQVAAASAHSTCMLSFLSRTFELRQHCSATLPLQTLQSTPPSSVKTRDVSGDAAVSAAAESRSSAASPSPPYALVDPQTIRRCQSTPQISYKGHWAELFGERLFLGFNVDHVGGTLV
jgi:hypothetical protein